MSNQSFLKEFSIYTILSILGKISISIYVLADTFFISRKLGTNGLAALNLALPAFNLFIGVGLMLGVGGATKYSIYKSRNDDNRANLIFTNTFYLSVIASLVFVFIGIFFSRQLTLFLGADQTVFDMTHTYLKTILIFSPAFIFNSVFSSFVRNDNNPSLAMFAMVISSLSNIVLDYVFMYPLKMGMFGAAFATCLSPIISMLILLIHKIRKENKFHFLKVKLDKNTSKRTLSLGFPSLIGELASGIVIVVFNMIILDLKGNIGIAAYGVISNLSFIVMSIFIGLADGLQPLVSREHGKRNKKNVNRLLSYALVSSLLLSVVIYIIIYTNADSITLLFNSEKNMNLQAIASQGLKAYFLATPFLAFNIVISTYFTSTERAIPAFIISMLRGVIIIIPAAFLMSSLLAMVGVWLSFPVTELIVAIIALVFYYYQKKTKGRY